MSRQLLHDAASYAADFLERLPSRSVGAPAGAAQLRAALDGPLPVEPIEPAEVVAALAEGVEPGAVGIPGRRYFGFVIGGALPAALAADWLTSTWDQNAGLFAAGPAASIVEEVAGRWLIDLLALPPLASFAFVTGCQMANFTALAAARNAVLGAAGWDVEDRGLVGAPPIRVLVGAERHITVDRALRYLGLGRAALEVVPADAQGRMRPEELETALAGTDGPTIVCAQAGNVNTGAFDPVADICDLAHATGAWVHVDGAFGLWARCSPKLAHLAPGIERADSWATDGHKMLNVPYDSGIALCAHPAAHRAAMSVHASYLVHEGEGGERDEMDWTPEFSRRARGFAIYAALRALGRRGVEAMVERCCSHAQRFTAHLSGSPLAEVLNDVVFNQVLVRLRSGDGDDDAFTRRVVSAVQADGTCWLSGSEWQGKAVMRISVSNWSTTEEDVDRSAAVILRIASEQRHS